MPRIQPPAPPAPPAPPTGSQPAAIDVGTDAPITVAQPRTAAEVSALKAKRSELSRQLESAAGRRKEVERDLNRANDVTRPGLEARLKTLDARLVQLEQEIAANGRALASAPLGIAAAESTTEQVRYGPFSSGQLTGITIVGTITVLMPLAIAAARAMLLRARQPKLTPEMIEATRRMERMEQSIDAVAVEVERISEGQRFVTQLMAKGQQERLPVGKGEG
jgi:DNA repair exonuclease SbcCD ATPase subunit